MSFDHIFHRHLARRVMAEKRADASTCPNIYLAPTMGQTVNSLDPLTITWNSTCLDTQNIDIYLYSPGSALPRIHVWEGVPLSRGTYNATLMPRWWNSTPSQNLQLSIVPSGQPTFLSQYPAGPLFIATYTAPASGTPSSADTTIVSSGITQVDNPANTKTLSPGKKAAAILLTLLFAILCIAAYIKVKRHKGKIERRRWTEAVDKRMSTISTDWKSVSVAGANAAIRNSIAVGNRSSAFSFGSIRPDDDEKESRSQMRTGVGLRNPVSPASTERVSRVSFAPDTRISRSSVVEPRPAGESRKPRAFHTAYVPPIPSLSADDSDSGSLSPRQSQGPLTLTTDDIRARVSSKRSRSSTSNGEMDEVMPALRMMRTGSGSSSDDFLFKIPDPPVAAYKPAPQRTASPVMSSLPMEPMPANVMSPDEMLRAYAERKASYPKAIAKKGSKGSMKSKHKRGGSNTIRTLYNAVTGSISSINTSDGVAYRQSASSIAEGHEDENMAGMGAGVSHVNAHPFGYHPNASLTYEGAHYGGIGDGEDDIGVVGRGTGAGPFYVGRAE